MHGALDGLGSIPVFGEPADVANAAYYAFEGDGANASIRLASALPIVGSGVNIVRLIWTRTRKLSPVENAFEHWLKHSKEFPGLQNAKQYVEAATDFLHNPPVGTVSITRKNGDVLRYNFSTNTFGIMDVNGVPRTMFKPTDGLLYWIEQVKKIGK